MPHRRLLSAALALLLPLLACSKTEDVAPEKKIFGDPPVFATEPDVDVDTQFHFQCNVTQIALDRLCRQGAPPDLEAINGGVLIEGTYTRMFMTVLVTDPNTTLNPDGTINRSDLLLVSASFTERDRPKPKPETTLVLFDDGSLNEFPQQQKLDGIGEDCTVEVPGECPVCQSRTYQLTSNDAEPNDSLFTRGFAFVGQGTSLWLQDCIMKEQKQAPFPVAPDTVFEFRIDAIDRAGNLTTWRERPIVTSGQDTFLCTGDECGCCFLFSSNPASPPDPDKRWERGGCFCLDGMISPSTFPDGLCKNIGGDCSS